MKPRILLLAAALTLAALPVQGQTELQKAVAAAYEAQAQAWVARAEALEADADADEARAAAWEQSIIATIAWNAVGEVDSAFVSAAREAASRSREFALDAREAASRSREFVSAAREAASRAREFVSAAREAASRAREFVSVARETASAAREFSSVAREAALDARETASRAEGQMMKAQANTIGQYATLWERAEAEAGGERTMWIRAEATYDAVEEAFDAAREAWNAEAVAWDRVAARNYVSRRKNKWGWEIGAQYSPGRFSVGREIPVYYPLGVAMTLERVRVNKPYSFFVPISFHYKGYWPPEKGFYADWATITFIGFGTRYYMSNGIYISVSMGGEVSGDDPDTIFSTGAINKRLWARGGIAFQGNMGWKISLGNSVALDWSLGIRERRYVWQGYQSRGFLVSVGISPNRPLRE